MCGLAVYQWQAVLFMVHCSTLSSLCFLLRVVSVMCSLVGLCLLIAHLSSLHFSHIVRRPRSVEFVRKPVLSAMGLLSLLGAHQIKAAVSNSG